MARTDGLKKTPGITKENAREMQRRSAEKKKQNNAERRVMMDVVKSLVTEEDRAAIGHALIEKAKNGDERTIQLLLQLLGEMPDTKTNIGLTVNAITEADRSLLEKVDGRV